MKNIFRTILAAALLCATQAMAQKQSLDTAPVPAFTVEAPTADTAKADIGKAKPAFAGPKLSYGLSAGMSYNSYFGAASYVEPTVRYQVSDLFRVFTSVAFVQNYGMPGFTPASEGNTVVYRNGSSNHYIGQAGLQYLVSDRLLLTASVWNDFSNNNVGMSSFYANPYARGGKFGADFRATYKVTEHFSVTGGVRYTNGASPFYSSPFMGSPGFGNNPF